MAGIGIAVQPEFPRLEVLSAGRLVAVLVGWEPAASAVNVLMPPGRPRAARVTVLVDFLIRHFAGGFGAMDGGSAVAAQ